MSCRSLLLSLMLAWSLPAVAVPAAGDVVDWSSADGIVRLERSQHKLPFFHLANHYEAQENKAFCGPATATIILNTLRLAKDSAPKPEDPSRLQPGDRDFLKTMDPLYQRYSQNTFFNANTDKVKTRAEVLGKPKGGARDGGIQLRQLQGMLEQHGLAVELHVVAAETADAAIKAELVKGLSDAAGFVVVNYHRPELGQKGGGHISPLGAYDDASDSFLIMDVNPNTAPWVWVKSEALIRAMRTKDTAENRGYLLVRDRS